VSEERSAFAALRNERDVQAFFAVGQRRFTSLVQQTPYFPLEIMHVLADRLRRNTSS
jgi:hypothetical protein